MGVCFFCGAEIPQSEPIHRSTLCRACGNNVKICKNCRFYDTGAAHECREPISEPVTDKERANFCDYFSLSVASQSSAMRAAEEKARAKEAFNKLFSDKT
ncbi:MAG: hypothetical protein ACQEQU_00175 [Spirochaetota bacterium]